MIATEALEQQRYSVSPYLLLEQVGNRGRRETSSDVSGPLTLGFTVIESATRTTLELLAVEMASLHMGDRRMRCSATLYRICACTGSRFGRCRASRLPITPISGAPWAATVLERNGADETYRLSDGFAGSWAFVGHQG
ncbi:hypothetical protein [uncultured Mycobacterium sp.]|uniref:hypothetical protein n=1 Tax=uncultured Mycobacterium sp. TaxID=171292 RepID=UPI0035C978F6